MRYLGHVISPFGVRTDPDLIEDVKKALPPTTIHDLQRVLGLFGYYRRFVKGYAGIAAPLQKYLRTDPANPHAKNAPKLVLSPAANKAFDTLKSALISTPILRLFDPDRPLIISTDGGEWFASHVVSQLYDDGEHPIAFWSREYNEQQHTYSAHAREMLSLVWAIKERHEWIGIKGEFIARFDHRSLQWLRSKVHENAMYNRWLMMISEFNIHFEPVRREENKIADAIGKPPFAIPTAGPAGPADSAPEEIDCPPGCDHRVFSPSRHAADVSAAVFACLGHTLYAPDLDRDQLEADIPLEAGAVDPDSPLVAALTVDEEEDDSASEPDNDFDAEIKGYATPHLDARRRLKSSVESRAEFVLRWRQALEESTEFKPVIDYLRHGKIPKGLAELDEKSDEVRDWERQVGRFRLTPNGLLVHSDEEDLTPQELNTAPVWRFVVPDSDQRRTVLEAYHEGLAHVKFGTGLPLLLRHFWWPTITRDFGNHCSTCHRCQVASGRTGKAPGKLEPVVVTDKFEKIAIDIQGPFPATANGNRYIVTAMDMLTRFVIIRALKSTSAKTVARFLCHEVFPFVGPPIEFVGNNAMMSNIVAETTKFFGSRLTTTTPYHPQANGRVEAVHKVVNSRLHPLLNQYLNDWDEYLWLVQYAINTACHQSIKMSPYEALFGRTAHTPLHASLMEIVQPVVQHSDYLRALTERGGELLQAVLNSDIAMKARNKEAYDQHHREAKIKVNDLVLLKIEDHSRRPGGDSKLASDYENTPLRVKGISHDGKVLDLVDPSDPSSVRTNRKISIDNVKLYHAPLLQKAPVEQPGATSTPPFSTDHDTNSPHTVESHDHSIEKFTPAASRSTGRPTPGAPPSANTAHRQPVPTPYPRTAPPTRPTDTVMWEPPTSVIPPSPQATPTRRDPPRFALDLQSGLARLAQPAPTATNAARQPPASLSCQLCHSCRFVS